MWRVLAAGSASFFFLVALVAFLAGGDRISAGAALAGLLLLSLAILVHVNDHLRR